MPGTSFANPGANDGVVTADGFVGPVTGDITGNVAGNVTGGTVSAVGVLSGDAATGITAFAGGGQASATALTKIVNSVDTVATAADSVKLPVPTKVGQMILIENTTATSMQVFGAGTDTINAVATGTGVAQAAGKSALYFNTTIGTAAKWFRILSA